MKLLISLAEYDVIKELAIGSKISSKNLEYLENKWRTWEEGHNPYTVWVRYLKEYPEIEFKIIEGF